MRLPSWPVFILVAVCGALVAACGEAQPPPAAPKLSVVPAAGEGPDDCERALQLRRRAARELEEGRLERGLGLLADANERCAMQQAQSWALQVEALAQLGRSEAALALADRIEQADASSAARQAAARAREIVAAERAAAADGMALLLRAKQAAADGDVIASRRLFDRARLALERESGSGAELAWRARRTRGRVRAWSPKGRYLALSMRREVSVVDMGGDELLRLSTHGGVTRAAFSVDESKVAIENKGELWLASLPDGRIVGRQQVGSVVRLAVRPDGTVVLRRDEDVCALRVSKQELECHAPGPTEGITLSGTAGNSADLGFVLFSALGKARRAVYDVDRRRLLRTFGVPCVRVSRRNASLVRDGKVYVVDHASGAEKLITRNVEGCSVWLSDDGRRVVVGQQDAVAIFDTHSAKRITRIAPARGWAEIEGAVVRTGHRDGSRYWHLEDGRETLAAAYRWGLVSPDGLLAAQFDGSELRISDKDYRRRLPVRRAVQLVAVDATGERLAFASGGTVEALALGRAAHERLLDERVPVTHLRFAPRAAVLAASLRNGRVLVWRHQREARWTRIASLTLAAPLEALALSTDGSELGVIADGTARKLALPEGRPLRELPLGAPGIALSADGRFAVSIVRPVGGEDAWREPSTMTLWDLAKGRKRGSFIEPTPVLDVAVLPGGHDAMVAPTPTDCMGATPFKQVPALLEYKRRPLTCNRNLRRYAAATGVDQRTFHDSGPLALSGDGKRVAVGSRSHYVRQWQAATGLELPDLEGGFEPILDVAMSFSGRRVAAAGFEGVVRLWDGDGALLTTIVPTADRARTGATLIHADGSIALLGDAGGDVRCRIGARLFPLALCAGR